MTADSWYALKVRPRLERTVLTHLRARGYDPFLPCYSVKHQWTDRIKSIELPLFPGYLFCKFDFNARFPILSAPGVNFVVGMGKVPVPVPPEEIDSIRTLVRSGLQYEPHPYVAVGQLVQIEQGALAGLTGLVIEVKGNSRLILSINLLMRSVSAEIERSWVCPIKPSRKQYFQSKVS